MKRQIIIGVALVASTLTISAPAHAFPYRNLEVDKTYLCEIQIDDSYTLITKDFSCKQIVRTSDVIACAEAGGQVGAIGTRPVCINERATKVRPKSGIPPFWPDAVAAKHFTPVTIPRELYDGQKDPRANAPTP